MSGQQNTQHGADTMNPIAHAISNTTSGLDLGTYPGATPAESWAALCAAAGCYYVQEPGSDIAFLAVEAQRYEIDESMMGYDWKDEDSLEKFASALRDVLGEEWDVVAITDSVNGAANYDDDDCKIELPLGAWDAAWETYAPEDHS